MNLITTLQDYAKMLEERGLTPLQIILAMHHYLITCDDKFNVEVKESPLRGKGIFATAKIKKEEVITFYPSHTLCVTDEESKTKEYYDTNPKRQLRDLEYGYTQFSYKSHTITSLGDPTQTTVAGLLAHMANDFLPQDSKVNFLPESGDALIKAWTKYEELKQELANACMIRHKYHTHIVATKDIEVGEEILISYGYPYWIGLEQDTFDKLLINMSEVEDDEVIDFFKLYGYDISDDNNK